MADALSWVMNNWMLIAGTASSVVAGASVMVRAIAPLTKTDKDDRAAKWLSKVNALLNKLALNPPTK